LSIFYISSSSPLGLLLRGAPDKARMLFRSLTPKRHRQLRVKDLPKVPTWRLSRAGFETTTIQTKGDESTIEPPRSTHM